MAVPTGTYQTFQQIGRREDLTDVIENITPTDTVFASNIKRTRATAVLHEFQTDALAAAANNAQIDGDDVATNTATPTVRFANNTQISAKVPRVSTTAQEISTAGRSDEMDYQIVKRGRELKRDRETALLGAGAATAGAAATARKLAGVALWLWTNEIESNANATTVTVTSGAPTTAPTAGTAATFTEVHLKSLLKACWDAGGEPGVVLAGSFNKQRISTFSGIGTQFRDAQPGGSLAPGSVIGAADVYISDFGQVQIVASRFMPTNQIYALDMNYWKLAELYPIREEPLAKTGLSDRVLLSTEYTLEASAPNASGKFNAATTS